jgi:peptide/nickel transport system substrate-binding protein
VRTVIVFLLGISLLGCDRATPNTGQDPVVRIGFGIGPSTRASGVNVLAELLYAEPLVGHDWTGRAVPRLAKSWSWNAEGTTLTLQVRDGVRFHDGSHLAPDVVARFLEKHTGEQRFGFLHIKGIETAPNGDVLVRLSQPDFFLLPELTEIKLTHPEAPDVGTGPFKLISRKPSIEVRRFDDYHSGRSALTGVRIQTFDTQRAAWAALMRNEVDVVQEVTRDSAEFMDDASSINTFRSLQPFYIPLLFNVRHPAFKHVEVRRAIVEVIDKTEIIDRAMRGRGRIAQDPIWPFHWAYPQGRAAHKVDVAHATARLDRAGFLLPSTGRPGELKKRFGFTCLVYNDPQFERIALLVQRQLFDVGIAMDIELVDLQTLTAKRAHSGEYDALLLPVAAGRAMDYTYRMWRSGADGAQMLNSGYTGVDELFDELRTSWTDPETRRVVAKLVNRFDYDAPAVFIAWTEVTRAVSSRFDVGESSSQDPFFNMWQWRPLEVTAGR